MIADDEGEVEMVIDMHAGYSYSIFIYLALPFRLSVRSREVRGRQLSSRGFAARASQRSVTPGSDWRCRSLLVSHHIAVTDSGV